MQESIFEIMERTQIVDKVLLAIGIVVPVMLALHYRLFRHVNLSPRMARWRVLFGIGAPTLYFLWAIFNAICDYYGLDSIFGLFINAVIFIIVGMAFCALDVWLRLGGSLAAAHHPAELTADKLAAETETATEKFATTEPAEEPKPTEEIPAAEATEETPVIQETAEPIAEETPATEPQTEEPNTPTETENSAKEKDLD